MKVKLMMLSRRRRRAKATIGTIPGTIIAHEGAVKGRIRVMHYDAKECVDQH